MSITSSTFGGSQYNRRESRRYRKMGMKDFALDTITHLWETKKPNSIAFLVVIILSFILIVVFSAIQLDFIYFHNYAIVVDAGINSTNIYLYKWIQTSNLTYSGISRIENCTTSDMQSIYNRKQIGLIYDCLLHLKSKTEIWYITKPTIHVLGTDGLRILVYDKSDYATKLLTYFREDFLNDKWQVKHIGVISEKQQALYIWMIINYKIIFTSTNMTTPTTATMNMKYDNLQVIMESDYDAEYFVLNNNLRSIHAKNYECYGIDFFYEKYRAKLLTNRDNAEVNCLQNNSPLFDSMGPRRCPKNIGTPGVKPPNDLKGIFKSSECQYLLENLIKVDIEHLYLTNRVKIYGLNVLADYKRFLEKYYQVTKDLSSFTDGSNRLCTDDYNDMVKRFPNNPEYSQKYCFLGQYLIALFKQMGFNRTTYKYIDFTNEITDFSVEWTYGYMSENVKDIPPFMFYLLNKIFSFTVISIFVAVFFVMISFLGFFIYTRYKSVIFIQNTRRMSMASRSRSMYKSNA